MWSVIIALSQVINAIKIYLPYNKRVKFLNQMHSELLKLFIEYDYLWFKVAYGDLQSSEINEKIKILRFKEQKINNDSLSHNHLPKQQKLITKANKNLECYFAK